MYERARYLPAGDSAVVVELGNEVNPEVNLRIKKIISAIDEEKILGIIETIPTYRSIMVIYDPLLIGYKALIEHLKAIDENNKRLKALVSRIIEIPTLYGGEYGPDIEYVAEYNNLTVDEVIRIHSRTDYLIYMLGFTPGYPYLGGLSEKIETPRLEIPRKRTMAGSVGIAGKQTGIYTIDSPGGWRIIGRTPIKLYDPDAKNPILLRPGDYLRFVPIDKNEYEQLEEAIREGNSYINVYHGKEGEDSSARTDG